MKNILALTIFSFFAANLYAGIKVDFETGMVESGYNDVKIPGNTGTLFSLSKDLSAKPDIFYRVTFIKEISDKRSWEILIAPLSVKADGTLKNGISFAGSNFSAGSKVDAVYRFDSYRFRYLFKVHETEKTQTRIGFTAKIRDASIKVSDASMSAEKKNTGFVPLFGFKVQWETVLKNLFILCEGDALAAPQGRAEDVLVALQYRPSKQTAFKIGYRAVEGGADNDEVYNFALLNYLVIGATLAF